MKKASSNVITVLVTFNRKKLLAKALDKLKAQNYTSNIILIVDNASTDGTYGSIKDYIDNKKVFYINTEKNIGGAGGFSFGLKYAHDHFDSNYYWLMDDDCLVKKDSLQKLLDADEYLKGQYGFLSSLVLWKDGKICEMNKQKIKQPWHKKGEHLSRGLIPTYYATFVSFFVKKEVVEKVGLPIREFFIWGDDVEYSNRISRHYDNYIVGGSIVEHATESNTGSDISLDSKERMPRYKYAYRNEIYIAKKNGVKGLVRQFVKINYHIVKVLFRSKGSRFRKIGIIISSSFKGIFFNPKVENIEQGGK